MINHSVVLAAICLCGTAVSGTVPAATGSLRVTVADEDGRPVEVTTVQLWIKTETGARGFTLAAQATEASGVFRVTGVPVGGYEGLKIDKPGYAPGWVDELEVRPDEEMRVACSATCCSSDGQVECGAHHYACEAGCSTCEHTDPAYVDQRCTSTN